MEIRNLTVSRQHCLGSSGMTDVPDIRISGYWIKELGYNPGDKIKVTVNDDSSMTIAKTNEVQL